MKPVIFLMGATATGKTGLAMELYQRFPLDIVSVDSAMVYRGMEIGAAQPTPAELAAAPHALIDIREPEDSYSAADFCQDARALIESAWRRERVPLLVGGTTLYFDALEYGLSGLPPADPGIREHLEAEAANTGWPALHQRLMEVDPHSAARIKAHDKQRIQRALEVYELTGTPLSDLQGGRRKPLGANFLKLVLTAGERGRLHQRIERRFAKMLSSGLLEEVAALMRRPGLDADSPAMRAVGYRQVWEHLQSESAEGFDELAQRVTAATRQLAKRQLTWLRQMPGCLWYDWPGEDNSFRIFKEVALFLELQG